ncbi:DUF3168 domain-containing protein [Clostridium formicaceticum]|uniref:DUF3168 domain-containing protein n=1 Tax=Clostridium formicaceticum TaxID=1497 RepID=A0AAC9RHZ4_9CLOT|nr:DUF3168 domain-containing protein [Clostridium formicaceticum]AOY76917.1 hypothetical protein BJL90_14265 [Clostridium formicaceticum]ARE87396.1 hypothetical protein CLFO_17960 [Clostridium formicaceticum]
MILSNFQRGMYELLIANKEIDCGVYDFIAEDEDMPFIVIGEDRAIDWNTKTWDGKEITTTIHIWAEKRSISHTKKLLDLIESTLKTDFEKDEYKYEYHSTGTIEVTRETVELVHGIIELTYRIKKEVLK